MRIEAIFFDIGDTLVTDSPTLDGRIRHACVDCALDIDPSRLTPALRRIEDYALEAYVDGRTTDDPAVMLRTAERLLEEIGQDPGRAAAFVDAFAAQPFERVLHPSALPLIDTLKSHGFKIGVISDWDPGLLGLLEEWDLAPRLDAVAVSAIVGCTKPDPRLFHHALAQANVDPSRALHVGDFYELDVAGARAAGMHALLYDTRSRSTTAGCARVVTFEELADFLLALDPPLRTGA